MPYHQLVGQQHRERLVTDDLACAPHGMTQPERLLLADIDRGARLLADALDRREALAAILERRFQLIGNVEMILERRFAAPGDEDDLLDPGLDRFFHRILDQRLIDDGQHLLRHCLGRRQESRPEASNGKNGLTQWLDRHSFVPDTTRPALSVAIGGDNSLPYAGKVSPSLNNDE